MHWDFVVADLEEDDVRRRRLVEPEAAVVRRGARVVAVEVVGDLVDGVRGMALVVRLPRLRQQRRGVSRRRAHESKGVTCIVQVRVEARAITARGTAYRVVIAQGHDGEVRVGGFSAKEHDGQSSQNRQAAE